MNPDSHPLLERSPVIQAFGSLVSVRLGLAVDVRHRSVASLNRLLAHTMALRDLYKKAHWQTSGATFYELHLLFDKHHGEQEMIMDALAERVQALGGVARALSHDVVEETRIARAPSGVESAANQLRRLVDAHEFILLEARPLARDVASLGDDGSNDLIVSQVVGIELLHRLVFLGLSIFSNQPDDSFPHGVRINPLEKGSLNAQSHYAAAHQQTVDAPLLGLLTNDGSPNQPVIAKPVGYMQIVYTILLRLHKTSDLLNLIALGRQIKLIRLIEQLHHTIQRIMMREIDRNLNFERLQVLIKRNSRALCSLTLRVRLILRHSHLVFFGQGQ